MKQGSEVMKSAFSSAGRQNARFILLSDDCTALLWGASRKTAKKKRVLVSHATSRHLTGGQVAMGMAWRLSSCMRALPRLALAYLLYCTVPYAAGVGHRKGHIRPRV
jgi:hypothetical protein